MPSTMGVGKLIEKQFKTEEILKRLYKFKPKKEKHYCLTLSRETGSGGQTIAQKVAKKLGLKYYDKKLVELITQEAKNKKELISSLDEKSRNWLSESLATFFGNRVVSSSTYFYYLAKTILLIARKENCLILGRGANFLISPKNSLRVRIIAPFKIRLENTIKLEKLSEKKAREMMTEKHCDRKDFVSRFFGKNISNANYYDLVINTANLTTEEAANIIIKAFKTKFPNFSKKN